MTAPGASTAGRFIADALAAAGVRVAYTVPGESFLPLLDGLAAAGIRVVATRHEGGAALMAAASASLSGRPTAVLATRAVGAANLAIGLHAAYADSAPVIALVGQVERDHRGREAFQEVDLVATLGGLCRWAREVRDVGQLPGALDEALRRATTARPGPVLLSLPADLLEGPAPNGAERVAGALALGPSRSPGPDPLVVRRILHLLLGAERPAILAGAGVLRSRGTADLVRFAELVGVPVIAGWRRPDVFPNDHALYLGMTGYFAAPSVRRRLAEADALLVIGSRLGEVASFGWSVPAPGVPWAHVDVEPLGARPGLGAPTIALAADARTFLREARRVLGGAALDAASFDRRAGRNADDRAAYEAARVVDGLGWDGPGVHPGRVVATLNAILPPDAIITTDAGNFGGWAARGLILHRPGTFLGPTAGAMGYGIPAAIAASLAGPGRSVIALVGDGGAGMTFMELETAVRERAHPVILVFDNQRYGTIAVHQADGGYPRVGTDLGPVDWARIAEGLGATGVLVDSDDEVEPAVRAAIASRQTTVIQLAMDRRWRSVDRLVDDDTDLNVRPEPEPVAEMLAAEAPPATEPAAEAPPATEPAAEAPPAPSRPRRRRRPPNRPRRRRRPPNRPREWRSRPQGPASPSRSLLRSPRLSSRRPLRPLGRPPRPPKPSSPSSPQSPQTRRRSSPQLSPRLSPH